MVGFALRLVLLNTDYCLVHRNIVQFRPVLSVTEFRRCRGASVKWIYLFRDFVSLKSRDKLFLYGAGSSNTRSRLSSPAGRHFLSSTFTWQMRRDNVKSLAFFFHSEGFVNHNAYSVRLRLNLTSWKSLCIVVMLWSMRWSICHSSFWCEIMLFLIRYFL